MSSKICCEVKFSYPAPESSKISCSQSEHEPSETTSDIRGSVSPHSIAYTSRNWFHVHFNKFLCSQEFQNFSEVLKCMLDFLLPHKNVRKLPLLGSFSKGNLFSSNNECNFIFFSSKHPSISYFKKWRKWNVQSPDQRFYQHYACSELGFNETLF